MKHLVLSVLLLVGGAVQAQVIQFTGLVVSGDSLVGVPDARVGVPGTRRHTVTALNGYFSLPVLAGDSIEVRTPSSTTHLRVPFHYPHASYSLLVELRSDAQPANVRRLEAGFSQRFLGLKLPPPPTVEVPILSMKGLVLPAYNKKGKRIN